MKRISRVLACALCAVLLAGVLPAGAATGSVRIVGHPPDDKFGFLPAVRDYFALEEDTISTEIWAAAASIRLSSTTGTPAPMSP